jgi:hypothetical protein
VAEIERRMVSEETGIHDLDIVFPQGTILSCSSCEERLYKITRRATTADLMLDDGTILQPLNQMIPKRRCGSH